ncbi:Hypothetical protein A7982_06353 [Minicystis rosea]|nr:Hypothetical protein A7982_06353 [Minicystis rosea]
MRPDGAAMSIDEDTARSSPHSGLEMPQHGNAFIESMMARCGERTRT